MHTHQHHVETLRRLGDQLARLSDADAIATHCLTRLGQILDLRWAGVAVHVGPAPSIYRWGDCPTDLPRLATKPRPGSHGLAATTEAEVIPLVAMGLTLGRLAVGPRRGGHPFTAPEHEFVATVGVMLALALQSAGLAVELEQQMARLERRERTLSALSARLMRVQEEERQRLALDLHDDPLQRAILLLREMSGTPTAVDLRRWRSWLEEIVTGLRVVCAGLRPRPLEDFGLVAGLESLVDHLRARTDLVVYLSAETSDGMPFPRLSPELELALFRIVQEALNNCVKHAQATQVIVTLWDEGDRLRLTVADDGRGFQAAGNREDSLHLGVIGMQERLGPWGGRVLVGPGASGGTVVAAEVSRGEEQWRNGTSASRSAS